MRPGDELIEHWERTERLLRAAIDHVSIDSTARQWFEEYLDHNELGLVYAVLVENAAQPLPDEARALLTDAATAMDLDPPPT